MGLALRNGFADLESPLPQAGLDQQNSKFNALAYHDRAPSAHMSSAAFRAVDAFPFKASSIAGSSGDWSG
jgi:hypothetical protein